MRFRWLLAALCLCVPAWGQGARFDDGVVTSASSVPSGAQAPLYTVPFASIKVCAYPAVGSPCTNVVNIYSDPALTQPISQPLAADVHGRFGFWASPGMYSYSVSSLGKVLGTYTIALAGAGGGSATFPSLAGIVYNLNSSTARNATYADIFSLFSGCSGQAVPRFDGTCANVSSGTVTNFNANAVDWPAWLVPSVATPTTNPTLLVSASPIPNSALANASITVNSTNCALGSSCTIPITGVTSINANSGPFTFTGSGVSCSGTTCTFSGGGGSMVYPGAGIANSTGTAWGTSYSATNLIPANFLPVATTGAFGAVKPDGTTITISGGVISSVGGGGGISGLTTGYIPQATSSTAIGNSFIDYGVTNAGAYTSSKDIYAPAFHSTDTGGAGFGFVGTEGTAPTGVTGSDGLWADSTTHRLMMNNNNTGAVTVASLSDQASSSAFGVVKCGTGTTCSGGVISVSGGGGGIADVTVTLPTTAIAANTCTAGTPVTMTGVTTSSAFSTAFATDPSAVTGWGSSGGLSFVAWPTANTLNWKVCNVTGSSITPGAMTLNVGAQ